MCPSVCGLYPALVDLCCTAAFQLYQLLCCCFPALPVVVLLLSSFTSCWTAAFQLCWHLHCRFLSFEGLISSFCAVDSSKEHEVDRVMNMECARAGDTPVKQGLIGLDIFSKVGSMKVLVYPYQ